MNRVNEVFRNQSVSVAGRRGMTVRVTHGRVWLTRDGDIKDYILNDGDAVELGTNGLVVLFGLSDATFQIDTPERAPGVWPGLLARFTWMGEQA